MTMRVWTLANIGLANLGSEGADMAETLRLRLAQIETRLALKRKEKSRLQEQQRKSEKQELSTLQVPQSPQKSPPKRNLPRSVFSFPYPYSVIPSLFLEFVLHPLHDSSTTASSFYISV
jgi:hypothetical protein